MAQIQEYVDVQVNLGAPAVATPTLDLQCVVGNHQDVLPQELYRYVTAQSWDTDLTSGSSFYNFAQTFFAQTPQPDRLMCIRFNPTGEPPTLVFPTPGQTVATWKAVTEGKVTLNSSTGGTEVITGITFAGIADDPGLADVAGVLQTAIRAAGDSNIPGLSTATVTNQPLADGTDSLVISMTTVGASQATINISQTGTPSTGIDLYDASYLNGADQQSLPGEDAKTPLQALQEVQTQDDAFYNIALRDTDDANKIEVAQWVETQRKQLDVIENNVTALDASNQTDLGSRIKALNLGQTTVIFHRNSAAQPDAAAAGGYLSRDAGTTNYAFRALSGVTESGDTIPLTPTDKAALRGKGTSFIETVASNTFLVDGLTAGGQEKRIVHGQHWYTVNLSADIFNFQLNKDVVLFSDDDFAELEALIRFRNQQAIGRGIIQDTPLYPVTVNIPPADTIPPSERATGRLNLDNVVEAYITTAIRTYRLIINWRSA